MVPSFTIKRFHIYFWLFTPHNWRRLWEPLQRVLVWMGTTIKLIIVRFIKSQKNHHNQNLHAPPCACQSFCEEAPRAACLASFRTRSSKHRIEQWTSPIDSSSPDLAKRIENTLTRAATRWRKFWRPLHVPSTCRCMPGTHQRAPAHAWHTPGLRHVNRSRCPPWTGLDLIRTAQTCVGLTWPGRPTKKMMNKKKKKKKGKRA